MGSSHEEDLLVAAGAEIERESFRIIEEEMGEHPFPPDHWAIVRRVIHTTGDFDYARKIRIHPDAISAGIRAFRNGTTIWTDTRMIHVGLAPRRLRRFSLAVETPASDPGALQTATEEGITRSAAAFRNLGSRLDGSIVAIGNAPTALLEILRLIKEENRRPSLVVGVPVGFVRADVSKEALWALRDQPSITVLGRKGGSPVAVAVLHALLDLATAVTIPQPGDCSQRG